MVNWKNFVLTVSRLRTNYVDGLVSGASLRLFDGERAAAVEVGSSGDLLVSCLVYQLRRRPSLAGMDRRPDETDARRAVELASSRSTNEWLSTKSVRRGGCSRPIVCDLLWKNGRLRRRKSDARARCVVARTLRRLPAERVPWRSIEEQANDSAGQSPYSNGRNEFTRRWGVCGDASVEPRRRCQPRPGSAWHGLATV